MFGNVRIDGYLVPYDDAVQEVVIARSSTDVMRAVRGSTTHCMNAICIVRHRSAFPHQVYSASVTRLRAYIIDSVKLIDDTLVPVHCVRYELSARDGKLIREHDRDGVGVPGDLRLRVPSDPKGSPKRAARGAGRFSDGGGHGDSPGTRYAGKSNKPITHRGAEARRIDAVGSFPSEESSK